MKRSERTRQHRRESFAEQDNASHRLDFRSRRKSAPARRPRECPTRPATIDQAQPVDTKDGQRQFKPQYAAAIAQAQNAWARRPRPRSITAIRAATARASSLTSPYIILPRRLSPYAPSRYAANAASAAPIASNRRPSRQRCYASQSRWREVISGASFP